MMRECNAYLITCQKDNTLFKSVSAKLGLPLNFWDTSLIYNWDNISQTVLEKDALIPKLKLKISLFNPSHIVILHTFSYHDTDSDVFRAKELTFLLREFSLDIPIIMVVPSLTNSKNLEKNNRLFLRLDNISAKTNLKFVNDPSRINLLLLKLLMKDVNKIITIDGGVNEIMPNHKNGIIDLSVSQLFVDHFSQERNDEYLFAPLSQSDVFNTRRIADGLEAEYIEDSVDSKITDFKADLGVKRLVIYSRRITKLDSLLLINKLVPLFTDVVLACSHLDLPFNEIGGFNKLLNYKLITTDSINIPTYFRYDNFSVLQLAPLLAGVLKYDGVHQTRSNRH